MPITIFVSLHVFSTENHAFMQISNIQIRLSAFYWSYKEKHIPVLLFELSFQETWPSDSNYITHFINSLIYGDIMNGKSNFADLHPFMKFCTVDTLNW